MTRQSFEPITWCPFDREVILTDMLTEEERQWINNYHQDGYKKISPLVDAEIADWLAETTKEI